MKKTLYLALALAAGMVSFTSCEDQLDIPQKGVVDADEFYNNPDNALGALAAAYQGFTGNVMGRQPDLDGSPGIYTPFKNMMNLCADDIYGAGGDYTDHEFNNTLNEFRYDTSAETCRFLYKGLYLSIYTCNLVIDQFGESTNSTVQQYVAEARVLRAYDHFILAALWGTPPVVEHVLPADALPYNCNNDANYKFDQKGLYEWVAKECEAAEPYLKERENTGDKTMAARVSKGFANALAGKAYLFAGNYTAAKTALKKVIDSKKYALAQNWEDLFHLEGDLNEEKIFEANIAHDDGKKGWSGLIQQSSWMEMNVWMWREDRFVGGAPYMAYTGIGGWGGIGVPQEFGDAFHANDGDSQRFKGSFVNIDEAVFGDFRNYADADLNAMPYEEAVQSDKMGLKGNGLYGNSFWLQKKFLMKASDTDGAKSGNNITMRNYCVMRYAEVLFNYAEALIQSGESAAALPYLQEIQKRAGSKHISTEATMNELKNEKKYEMWAEGCRWLDIMRWKDADAIAKLKKAGTNVPVVYDTKTRPIAAGDNVLAQHSDGRFYIVGTQDAKDHGHTVGFQEGKHELFPIPLEVMEKNPNLVQNPGW